MDRRTFLKTSGATAALFSAPQLANAAISPTHSMSLTAAVGKAGLLGTDGPATDVWSYNGRVPGPVIRAKQGEHLNIEMTNQLDQNTTIHWHGLRVANNMDGVPFLNQYPIEPTKSFTYSFQVNDAGTYWYHPHVNSDEQVGRGLAGAIIIEEQKPVDVDRDLVWVLDDWRVNKDGQLVPFGGNLHDAAHAGRIGNVATINGIGDENLHATTNERIRLRLINTANARVFGLDFKGHSPWRIAVDGHPVQPQKVEGLTIIPPGGRVDLILDLTGDAGTEFNIIDGYYGRNAYLFSKIKYVSGKPLRSKPLAPPTQLAANPVAKPDLSNAEIFPLVFAGGAMGGMRDARFRGETLDLRTLAGMGMVWAINGEVIAPMTKDDIGKPILDLTLGKTYQLRLTNDTAFDHPIHLHGHSFHLLSRNGNKLEQPEIMDTVLISPDQYVDIAFVADNPGNWAFHCHVLEHAASGMMGYVRVG